MDNYTRMGTWECLFCNGWFWSYGFYLDYIYCPHCGKELETGGLND